MYVGVCPPGYSISFCYLGDTSGVNLFQTIFRSIKILDRFQVNDSQ